VQTQKKQWMRPQLRQLELGQARERMEKALSLMEADPGLEAESAELRSILRGMDELQKSR